MVMTPDSGVLEGVTRQTVFDICAELGLSLEVRPLPADQLTRADEIFMTSTAGGIMPVGRLDGRVVGDGAIGPTTGRINRVYWEWHADPAQTTALSAL
jgi:branched-chain amino acid aminotransferase